MFKQVKFIDNEGETHGGIFNEQEGYIICGCCGGIFEKDEVKIADVYYWIDLDETILGDD